MGSKYTFVQKVVTLSSKRPKVENLPDCHGELAFLFYCFFFLIPTFLAPTRHMHEYKGCSEEALDVMANNVGGFLYKITLFFNRFDTALQCKCEPLLLQSCVLNCIEHSV
jgi:hypothetical protein